MNEKANPVAASIAGIGRNSGMVEQAEATGRYVVECFDADGNLKWCDEIKNLVTTAGKNDALDKYLAGSAYTAAWYLGLISSTGYGVGPAAADTASSHAGWTEDQNYSQGARPPDRRMVGRIRRQQGAVCCAYFLNQRRDHHQGLLPDFEQHQGWHQRHPVLGWPVLRRRQGSGQRRHPERQLHRLALIGRNHASTRFHLRPDQRRHKSCCTGRGSCFMGR